jgi:hypothetical protein
VTARPNPAGRLRATPVGAVFVLLLALLVAACATSTVTPGASSTAVASPSSGAGGGLAPSATPWPGGVVEAVVILGKADAGIQAAGADLGAAAASEDLDAMRGAADGLVTLLERLETQVPRIKDYAETAPAAAAYEQAFPDMLAGAKQVRDSITAGDAAGIAAGSQQLAKGLEKYREARRLIGPLVDQALLMQRLLLK